MFAAGPVHQALRMEGGPLVSVLLVDDSPSFLASARRFVEAEGLTVVGAVASGRQALEAVARLRPSLVLMDVAMPDMNGIEATRLIKASPGAPRVIVVTLHDTEEYGTAAAAAHADGFVDKSQIESMLMPAIRTIFPGFRA